MKLPFVADDQKAQRNFEELEQRIAALENTPHVRASVGAIVAVPTATVTIIPFTNSVYDSHNFHEGVTNPSRFTVPKGLAGLYLPFMQIATYTAGVACRVFHKIAINGSAAIGDAAGSQPGYSNNGSSFSFGQIFPPVRLADADYVEFTVFQESGASVNINAGTHNHAGLIRIGRR